jgi:hypothetical protein
MDNDRDIKFDIVMSYNLMLNSGNKFCDLRDKKNKYCNCRIVRKKCFERNKPQNLTLGYMTKNLNQTIFSPPPKPEY